MPTCSVDTPMWENPLSFERDALALHNSDDSDGWEREDESAEYFHAFAEDVAYPMAINVLIYIMTHQGAERCIGQRGLPSSPTPWLVPRIT